MPTCAAKDCKSRTRPGVKITFHLFPKNPEIREKWIPITGRKNWTPSHRAVLCSHHFEEPCFDRTGQTTRLRAGAIPTRGKHAPKMKKKQIIIKQEPEEELTQPLNKSGITTRLRKRLGGLPLVKRDPSEDESADIDEPPTPPQDQVTVPIIESKQPAAGNPTYPDHYYCRTQSETDALLKKNEQKVEFLKMKLDYLNGPRKLVKQEPPDWTQFKKASLMKEAELIKASVFNNVPMREDPEEVGIKERNEKLKEKLKEAEQLQKKIKTLQQRSRRSGKKKSKAKFFRYVVMIEPTKSGKKKTSCSLVGAAAEEAEGQDGLEEAPSVDQVSSIQNSILSHTASMMVGPNNLLEEKDKEIENLQKKVKIAKQREKRKAEQIEHLHDVIEILKDKCDEYSSPKEAVIHRHCALCQSSLYKRCQRIAELWASSGSTSIISSSLPQLRPVMHGKAQSCSVARLESNTVPLCAECKVSLPRRGRQKISSFLHNLNPHC